MTINVEPSKDHKIPYDVVDDSTQTFDDELKVVANTQSFLEQLGSVPEFDEETARKSAELLKAAVKNKNKEALNTPAVAFGAKAFVQEYGKRLAFDMSEVRTAITQKLMDLANCGDAKYELKALELLGKHSDIALFTERSEVTVNYKSSSDLEDAIKERIKRLLNATEIEGTRIDTGSLDDELGVAEAPAPKEDIEYIKPGMDEEEEDGGE